MLIGQGITIGKGIQVDADVGFVKVWNKELTLAEIQAEHATYKTRFGY